MSRPAVILMILASVSGTLGHEQQLAGVASSLSRRLSDTGRKSVAVTDFTDLQGNISELGRFLAEELSVALADVASGFVVVDRLHLRTLIQEHKLSSSGLIDSRSAQQLGKIAGVDVIAQTPVPLMLIFDGAASRRWN